MKKAISALSVLGMALALAWSAGSPGLHAQKARVEQHPDIRRAVGELQKTRTYLTLANHYFGGHRDDAIKAVDEAIKQLSLAEQFDNK